MFRRSQVGTHAQSYHREFRIPNFEFPTSNFDFRPLLGGKSAAQQLRGRHTALGGFG
jgi:hypothetical protein